MPRPCCRRFVSGCPGAALFKPAGIPSFALEVEDLGLDEFEALRLADLEGLHHAAAAERMGISRATFGRIVEQARRKTARALVHGKALRIEGARAPEGMIPLETEQRCCRARGGHAPGRRGRCLNDTNQPEGMES